MNPLEIEQAAQRRAEKRAKTSIQLGALSFLLTWLTGIPAMVIGAMALAHASPSVRKRALTGIGLGSFTSLGTAVVLIVLAVASPPTASTPTASAQAAASASSGTHTPTWKSGEIITVGKCSYRLKKAFKRIAPDDAEPRPHRLWQAAVAVEASQTDELDAWCSFNLQLRTVGSDRLLGEDSTASQIAPGSKKCMSEGISESVPRAMTDVRVVLQLGPDAPKDQGFLKGLARDSLRQKEIEVGAQLLSWDDYSEKVGFTIDCD